MPSIGPTGANKFVEGALTRANNQVSKSMERLATGRQNAAAGDRTSYVAMADTFKLDYVGTKAGIKSAAVTLGYLETGLRAIDSASRLLARLQELAVLSANATNTEVDSAALDAEGEAIADEFHRILATASYKGKDLFQSTAGSQALALGGRSQNADFGIMSFDYDALYDYRTPDGAIPEASETYKVASDLTASEKEAILAQTTGLTADDLTVGATFTTDPVGSVTYGGAGVTADDLVYSDTDGAVRLDDEATVVSSSTYNGGSLEVALTNNGEASDDFNLVSGDGSVGSVTISNGEITYIDAVLGAIVVGEVDTTDDGQDGQALKINFSDDASIPGTSNILNGDFSNGLNNWEVYRDRVDFGNTFTTANGITVPTPTEAEMAIPANGNGPGNDDGALNAGAISNGTATVSNGELVLNTGNLTSQDGYAIIHGPAVVSDTFAADAGDVFKFDYSASANGDDFHVAGYLVNTADNSITMALNETGRTASGTASVAVSASGTYRFVFVNGTYDASGGRALGAGMTVDNIRSEDPYNITSDVVQEVLRSISYENTTGAQATVKDVRFTVSDGTNSAVDTSKILNNEFTNNLKPVETFNLADPLSYAIRNSLGEDGLADTSVITARIEAAQNLLNNARVSAASQYAALESSIRFLTDLTAQYELGYNVVNDVNFSIETAHLAKQQILQQAANAMLVQSNPGQEGLLDLVR